MTTPSSGRAHPDQRFARRLLPVAAAVLAVLSGSLAQAQQAARSDDKKADDGKVESVIITATKRPQPLQTTPIAISVLGGEQLEQANLNTLGAITTQTPTVNFRTNASNKDSALFIRGVGTISTSPGVEPTVSTVIDGVVTARPGQSTLDLLDVERIEILRGPQGTLFGKNASAGVINIVTKPPSKASEGYVDLSYYQGNEKRIKLGWSGEVNPNVARAQVSFMKGTFDGNVTNVFDGSKVNGYDRTGIRGKLELTPSKAVKVTLIADHMKSSDDSPTGVMVSTTTNAFPTNNATNNPLVAAAILPVVASPTNRQINSDLYTNVQDKNSGLSAQIDWELAGGLQLTSITAYRKWDNTQFQDQDRLPQPYRQFARTHDRGDLAFSQTSQELRVASPKGQFFDYVAGAFWLRGKDDERYERDVTRCAASTAAALPSGLIPCTAGSTTSDNGVANYGTKNTSTSLFGEGNFNFSEQLHAIAGLRYTTDELSYYHGRVATAAGVPGVQVTRATVTGSTTQHGVSGRIGPQYELSKDTMVYATYSRGYKGPAYNVFFNMTATQDNVLKPETSDAYELGLKTTVMDGRLRLNVAAFNTQYANYQANVPDLVNGVVVTRLINAGDVSTKGVEMDLAAKITPQFTVSGAAAYIVARVDNFNCPPGAATSCNINGYPLPFSPDWKLHLRGKYSLPLANGLTVDLGGDYSWQSKTQFDLAQNPNSIQPAYGVLNLDVGLSDPAKGWRVTFLVKNVGDKSYATFLQNSGNNINRYVPRYDERTMGVSARWDF